MAEQDKEKTAFTFGRGLWQFRVMSFGLCNALATFEHFMERVLEGLRRETALVYLNDGVVFGHTFEQEIGRLEEVFRRFGAANLKLSPKKCLLFQREVPFLGHIVGQDGVELNLRSQTPGCHTSWIVIQELRELEQCSAMRRMGEHVVAYYSQFNPPERNYCVTRKLLAVVKSLDNFHPYLYGAQFTVRTDHAALSWLKILKNPEGQLARWSGKLKQHNYRMEHRPGRVHSNADSLSHRPCKPDCQHCSPKEERVEKCHLTVVQDTNKPAWEEVTALSPATKHYWAQWESPRHGGEVLLKKWMTADGCILFWLTVVSKKLRARVFTKKGPRCKTWASHHAAVPGWGAHGAYCSGHSWTTATTAGNRYICVAMGYFTKWPEAYVLPNYEATNVAGVLVEKFFTQFGVPGDLYSDQGREFESAVFQECCQLLGLRKMRTTNLQPQSEYMVEKFNWMPTQELAKYCGEGQTEWDQKLLMAYRSAEHEATGYKPANLMLFQEIRLLVDLITGRLPDEELPTVSTDYAALQERLAEIVHIDLLWRYYGPEQYMWGSGDGDDEDEEESSHEELQEDEEDAAAGTGGDDEKDEMRRQTQLGQRSNLYCRSPS
ncbi:uncharacterized protein LOC135106214 [Scylla paramamosain]|uniref:uncharacterized protein LOC135106214 n=1 Tax=Scylla paramamosain TaxID=85552 RepID=UPI003082BEFB